MPKNESPVRRRMTAKESDAELARGTTTWRGGVDKVGYEHTVGITDVAKAVLQAARKHQRVIRDTWIFPAQADPKRPASSSRVRHWWERLHKAAGLPKGNRPGWHSLRRRFATELKRTPLKDLAHLRAWKNPQTILLCYREPDEQTQRDALAARVTIRQTADAKQIDSANRQQTDFGMGMRSPA